LIKGKILSLAAGVTALATVGFGALAAHGSIVTSGGGGSTPPWEASISPAPNGAITFYNAKGQVVTGGSINDNGLGAYAVASTADGRAGDTKAELFVYTPVPGENPGLWSGEQISASTNWPNGSAPAPIGSTGNPVETNPGDDTTLADYISSFPNNSSTTGYVNLYDIRLKVSGPGIGVEATYWDTVISVDTGNNTWSLDFPDWTQNTTTGLTASPPSPQTAPANPITLTATVSPASDGTVSFWNGATQVGTTQTVTGGDGTAQVTTTPPQGSTPYVAIFTPTVGSSDVGSESSTLNYSVVGPPNFVPTLLGPGGAGTARVGGIESCLASFDNATTVTYAWQANGTAIPDATSSTYTPVPVELNQSLTCSVQATNSAGSVSGTSNGANIGLGAALVPTAKPKLSGPHTVGGTEKVTAGTWKPAAVTVTYQWFIGTKKVTGATKSSFKVPSSAKGKKVHCVVTASAPGFANGVFTTPSVTIG
jgi:hypothetical protein